MMKLTICFFALLLTIVSAHSQTLVVKKNDQVKVDWSLATFLTGQQIKRTFGADVRLMDLSENSPPIEPVNTPLKPKVPIQPWCDCPEEMRKNLETIIKQLPTAQLLVLREQLPNLAPNFTFRFEAPSNFKQFEVLKMEKFGDERLTLPASPGLLGQ